MGGTFGFDVTRLAWPLAAGVALLWLALAPPTPDLAAQVFRTDLFEREGFTLFNGGWYGGHHTPAYSILFPPLSAAIGPRVLGLVCAAISAALFQKIVARWIGEDQGRWAVLWFAVATVTDLMIGRLTFSLGATVGLAAVLAAMHGRLWTTAVLAAGCSLASPVAGLFLFMAGVAVGLDRRDRLAIASVLALPSLITILALTTAFPEGGEQPFRTEGIIALVGCCVALIVLVPNDERYRVVRIGAFLYLLGAIGCAVIDTPIGSNVNRLGATFGAPLLLATAWGRRPTAAVLLAVVPLVAWQWWAPVRETEKGIGDPSATAAYYGPLLHFLHRQQGPMGRIEVPFTRLHWESVHVAPDFPMARGWETQLDTKYNALFHDGKLTSARYERWLKRSGVRFVALPDVPLDGSSIDEAKLLARPQPYLTPVWDNAHWKVWEVRDTEPLVSGVASLRSFAADGFTLNMHRSGDAMVRVRFTPYWAVAKGAGCVSRAPGGWTRVTGRGPRKLKIVARFSPGRVVDHGPRCRPA